MFRRRIHPPAAEAPASDEQPTPTGKGRPTPKRRDSEGRRRQPISAPRDRKAAYRQARDRARAERAKAQESISRGEERHLPPRDKGPMKRFARDWVDSRRLPSQYFLPFSIAILLLIYLPLGAAQQVVYFAVVTVMWPLMMVSVILSCFWVARTVKKQAIAAYPLENPKGVGLYAAMRAMQIRKFRFPPPVVRVGEKPSLPRR
ncbi:DUF3043 domain-containing protein [Rhizohabitans arisaemae]|uniref:DUF3043 domain-containing protein n=1 Tax=Rhizohabitans arisaemae TaxID=2720610 RepID=UPI0024B048C3|nr:DUF3043 domain-containing protein [Rhizohabitans arisaemae]